MGVKMEDLAQSPLLQVFRKERPSRKPCWFMRQAGRYLPEYRELRKKNTMLQAIQTPTIAAEITLQPLKRFDLDAAIVFADILTPLIEMGVDLDFVEGHGPKIGNLICTSDDVQRLRVPDAATNASYTFEAISLTSSELNRRGIPVLGFAGAPFTLASYMIQGGGGDNLETAKHFIFREPAAWESLSLKLIDMLGGYLAGQVKAGASALQIFDSWVGALSPYQYQTYCLPYLQKLFTYLRAECPGTPLVYFSTGTAGLLDIFTELDVDVLSTDWRMPLSRVQQIVGPRYALQGNLDPAVICGAKEQLEVEVQNILSDAREIPHHVFNLGHGILPSTPIENVERCLELVRKFPYSTTH